MSLHLKYFVVLSVCLPAVFMLAGCQGSQPDSGPHGALTDADMSFADGTDRAPTPNTLYTMANIFASQGRDSECLNVLTRLIAMYPDYLPAYNALASLHLRHDRIEEATWALMQGLKIQPEDPVLINNMGMCCLLRREYAESLTYFNQAAQLSPRTSRYHANIALTYGLMGKYDKALEIYLLVVPPGEAHYNVSICAKSRGDMEKAGEELAMAKQLGFVENKSPKKKAE